MLTLPFVKIWKSFLSVDPLPSVVGVLDDVVPLPDEEVPPLLDDPPDCEVVVTPDPDDEPDPLITFVAGLPPPPPPPHAVRTNMLAAAAKRAAVPLLCMRSHSQAKRPYRAIVELPERTNAVRLVLVPPKFAWTA
jgi:hypothetical protein